VLRFQTWLFLSSALLSIALVGCSELPATQQTHAAELQAELSAWVAAPPAERQPSEVELSRALDVDGRMVEQWNAGTQSGEEEEPSDEEEDSIGDGSGCQLATRNWTMADGPHTPERFVLWVLGRFPLGVRQLLDTIPSDKTIPIWKSLLAQVPFTDLNAVFEGVDSLVNHPEIQRGSKNKEEITKTNRELLDPRFESYLHLTARLLTASLRALAKELTAQQLGSVVIKNPVVFVNKKQATSGYGFELLGLDSGIRKMRLVGWPENNRLNVERFFRLYGRGSQDAKYLYLVEPHIAYTLDRLREKAENLEKAWPEAGALSFDQERAVAGTVQISTPVSTERGNWWRLPWWWTFLKGMYTAFDASELRQRYVLLPELPEVLQGQAVFQQLSKSEEATAQQALSDTWRFRVKRRGAAFHEADIQLAVSHLIGASKDPAYNPGSLSYWQYGADGRRTRGVMLIAYSSIIGPPLLDANGTPIETDFDQTEQFLNEVARRLAISAEVSPPWKAREIGSRDSENGLQYFWAKLPNEE